MFKQFTENITAVQGYLLFSLGIFLLFFIIVSVLLLRMKKDHIDNMSDMPLHDSLHNPLKGLQS